jgi:basic membrane protein A
MLKRVDVAVYETIKSVKAGSLSSGITVFGLDNNGVGYAMDKYNAKLVNKKMRKVVDQYRQKIINGEISVSEKR